MKRILSILVATVMLLETMGFTVFATEELAPGSYDSDWNLISSWDELVADGLITYGDELYGDEYANWLVDVDDSIEYLVIDGSTVEVIHGAFSGNASEPVIGIKAIKMTEGVKAIGYKAFNYAVNLAEVELPESMEIIEAKAFFGSGLTSVTIRSDIDYIDEDYLTDTATFRDCQKLEEVIIEDGVTTIPATMFRDCYELENIVIPASVTSIGDRAFYDCLSLSKVVIMGQTVEFGNQVFDKNNTYTDEYGNVPVDIYTVNDTVSDAITIGGNAGSDSSAQEGSVKIGDTYYVTSDTFADAIADADGDDVIILMEDVTLASDLVTDLDAGSIVIDLNKNTLALTGNTSLKDGTYTIKNGIIDVEDVECSNGEGLIRLAPHSSDLATLTLEGVTVNANRYSAPCGLFCFENGILNLDNTIINAEDINDGYGVFYSAPGNPKALTISNSSEINVTNAKKLFYGCNVEIDSSEVNAQVEKDIFSGASATITNSTLDFSAERAIFADAGYDAPVSIVNSTVSIEGTLSNGVSNNSNPSSEVIAMDSDITGGDDSIGTPVASIGTTPYADLEEAIANAEEGDTITVFAGTYDAFNIDTDNITIKGAEDEEVNIVITDVTNGGVKYNAGNLTFENLNFIVDEAATGSTWNISALGYYYENVGPDRDNLSVIDCDFINNSDMSLMAIFASDTESYEVSGCTFKNFSTGIATMRDNSQLGEVTITENQFENVDTLVSLYWGVKADDGEGILTFTENTVDGAYTEGKTPVVDITDHTVVSDREAGAIATFNIDVDGADVLLIDVTPETTVNAGENTNLVSIYRALEYAEAYANEGDEFYLNYGEDTQTKAVMGDNGIEFTEISSESGKAAFVNGVYYDTLGEAVAALAEDDEIILLSDATLTEADADAIVAKPATITIDEYELTIESANDYEDIINVPKRYKVKTSKVKDGDGNVTAVKYTLKKKTTAAPVGSSSGVTTTPVVPEADIKEEDNSANQIILTIGDTTAKVFGEDVENDVAPKIVNERTMLPARFVAENLGATVTWTAEEPEKVLIEKGDVEIIIIIGSDIAYVNGEEVALDSPAFIENDRTYTPIRFITEELGATIEWNDETKQAIITVSAEETVEE